MLQIIEKYAAKAREEWAKKVKANEQLMNKLQKQAMCDHSWKHIPSEKPDNFCFSPGMPQILECKKCGIELWNNSKLHPDDRKIFAHILADMGIDIEKKFDQ
jgi:hypothetical protein